MVTTSLDVLYITLSVCVGFVTIFLCWALYYFVRMERNTVYTMEKFTSVLRKADEILEMAKEKLHSSGMYVAATANAVKTVVEYLQDGKAKKKTRK